MVAIQEIARALGGDFMCGEYKSYGQSFNPFPHHTIGGVYELNREF